MRTHCQVGGLLLAILALVCAAAVPAVSDPVERLQPRWVRSKPVHTQWRSGWHENLVVLKCVRESCVRLRNGRLVSLNGTSLYGLHQVLMTHGAPGVRRLFSRPESMLDQERASGQLLSGRELADLNLYYLLTTSAGDNTTQLVDDLNALAVVELAYFEPVAVCGAIHQEARGDPLSPLTSGLDSTTPDFSGIQYYLDPAPQGLDARYAWGLAGGQGQGGRIGVVERGVNPGHEDLPWPESWVGGMQNLDHGTAVLGEVLGQHNGFGVMGIAPQTELHLSIFEIEPPFPVIADAINELNERLDAGDVMLVEYHAVGPPSGETCYCSCYSFEYIPLEYWQANFDAIATMTANRVVCVEIAGNGSMDLDHPRYFGAFERGTRDSGAILVGAVNPGTGKPSCWTNFGSRLDLCGYGSDIVTTGYGLLYSGGPDATYTGGFGGTSGAGAMVAGAVCAFQGWVRSETGLPMTPDQLREYLCLTGTPQGSDPRQVGPQPDLREAILGPASTISAWNTSEN